MSVGDVQRTGANQASQASPATTSNAQIKQLAAQVSGGDLTGLGQVQGAVRRYQGRTYVSKPVWTPSVAFSKSAAAAHAQQKSVFQEQRAQKHLDRVLDELQRQPGPRVDVIKRSLKFLDKCCFSGGATLRELVPLQRSGMDNAQRAAGAARLKGLVDALIQDHGAELGGRPLIFAKALSNRLDSLLQGLAKLNDVQQFQATDQGAFLKNLQQSRIGAQQATASKTPAARAAEIQQFANHGIGSWTDKSQVDWKVSSGGAGGVLLVFAKGTNQLLGVLKIDNAPKTAVSSGIAAILQHVQGNAPTPLPFNFPLGQFLKADAQGTPAEQQLLTDLTQLITEQKTQETDPQAQRKCDRYLQNLAEAKGVTRYSAAEGKEFQSLSLPERIEVFNSPQFAEDVAAIGVLAPFMGMNDHVGLIRGGTNIQNLLLGSNGQTTVVDFEGAAPTLRGPDGTQRDAFGFLADDLTDGVDRLLNQLQKLVDGTLSFDEMTRLASRQQGDDPLTAALQPLLAANASYGMFPEKGVMGDIVTPDQQKAFLQRVVSQLGDKLTLLKTMAPAIGQAHDSTPTSALHGQGVATMQKIVQAIEAFDQRTPGGGLAALKQLAPTTSATA